ncbi:Cytochrome c-type biogenesis protein CcmE [Pseudolycoriella hygida]|uniref:Cytochrome c-type biogenesis protein CcmE n=1 Tax=Pseudolycoriella hygida TaxID=35572 RepID=A0A9Q0N7I3_9DIPT|nr:Cytochrome c-type biogenesis protein CcmE [Pseudolycoriella hygida]
MSSLAIYMILHNLKDNITFFYPPSKINAVKTGQEFRVGGLVKVGSIEKEAPNRVNFIITDNIKELAVTYQGLLPALFRENQGIVAAGKINNNVFIARELLTKHDENYSPTPYKFPPPISN